MQTITILNYTLLPPSKGQKNESLTLDLVTTQGQRAFQIEVGHYEKRPTFNNKGWYDLCQGDAPLQSAFLRAVAGAYCKELRVPFVVIPEQQEGPTTSKVKTPMMPDRQRPTHNEDMDILLGRSTSVKKPMTNLDIRNAADTLGFGNSISFWEIFELGVKAAERHHGIVRPITCEAQKA